MTEPLPATKAKATLSESAQQQQPASNEGSGAAASQRIPVATRRVALLSDPHCYRVGVGPWALVGKRIVGWGNLVMNRRNQFDAACFARAVHRAHEIGVDLLLLSGDLTQTALSSEFRMARRILEQFPGEKLVIPGNHDRYTWLAQWSRRFERNIHSVGAAPRYPYRRELDDHVRLIGLDPTRPSMNARGTLPLLQLRRLEQELKAAREAQAITLLACHYPVVVPPKVLHRSSHKLTNETDLRDLLVEHKQPVIYCNGHIHRMWVYQPEEAPHILTLNPGSCGTFSREAPLGNGFMELVFERFADGTHRFTVHAHRQAITGRWLTREITTVPKVEELGRELISPRLVTFPQQAESPEDEEDSDAETLHS